MSMPMDEPERIRTNCKSWDPRTTLSAKHARDTSFDQTMFFDRVLMRVGAKSMRQLAFKLGISPSTISKIRARDCCVSNELILLIHDVTDISIAELKEMAGIPKFVRTWFPENK